MENNTQKEEIKTGEEIIIHVNILKIILVYF